MTATDDQVIEMKATDPFLTRRIEGHEDPLPPTTENYPDYFRLTSNLTHKVVEFSLPNSDDIPDDEGFYDEVLEGDVDPTKANLVTSKVHPRYFMDDMHKVVLDIDMDAALVPSTTPGHFHLYLEKYMPAQVYQRFLKDMAKYGIISEGYAAYAARRGETGARTPWTKKDF